MENEPPIRMIASYAGAAFGGTPRFTEYTENALHFEVDILSCADRPVPGVTSYSTVGLSGHPMIGPDGEFPVRLELAGACESDVDRYPDLLADAAFWVVRTGGVYYPGAVILNGVSRHIASVTMQHLYLTTPFLWQDRLKTLDCGSIRVSWLLAVPISESERSYLIQRGLSALEDLLEEHEVDIFDLNRSPVV
jgi:hypothetical protein